MQITDIFDNSSLYHQQQWVLTLSLIVLAAALTHFLEIKLYNRLIERARRTKFLWDDAILWSIHKPLGFLIWLWAFSFTAKIIYYKTSMPYYLFDLAHSFVILGTITVFTWFLLKLTNCIRAKLYLRTDNEDSILDLTTSQALAQATQIIILATSGLIILKQFFSISFTGLWAIGGIGSFIIGWAAKDLLANFFGAIMIYFDRPFSIGDWIRSPDREIEGIVEYIGWRLTKIRTFDKRPLYIPNSLFATICVENVSQTTFQRIKENIAISFSNIDRVEAVMNDIKEMLNTHPAVEQSMNNSVNLTGINKSSLNVSIVCFVKMPDWTTFLGIKQDIILQVLKIIHESGAELDFPTSVLKLSENDDFLHNKHSYSAKYI